MTTMTNKKFFDDLLMDRGMSLRQLARMMDILPSQLSRTFTGKRRMQIDEAVKIGQILGASLHDVALNAGIEAANSQIVRVPVIGFLNGDGGITRHPRDVAERVTLPMGLPEDSIAVQARTMDTQLAWLDGFLYFGAAQEDSPDMSMLGRLVRARIKGGPEVIGTLRRGYEPGKFSLAGAVSFQNVELEWMSPIHLIRP